ncbi:MAG: leucine-rich repeat protein [Oscillospiraceae bacterium]|nr:leucine-rich repeat protein [Oscillospiraceae bacterium]
MKKRIIAMLAAFAMLLTCSALPAFAEDTTTPEIGDEDLLWEPMPPSEEVYSENGLVFIIYTPNQYVEVVRDKYACVAGVEEGVTSVTIPAAVDGVPVNGILDAAFRSTDLTEILVGEGQENFTSADGVLFNADGTKLLAYPLGKTGTYAVPNGTQYIARYAFAAPEDYDGLTAITFPDTLTEIREHALENQAGLTVIDLPDACQKVQEAAFQNCKNVTTLHISKNLDTFYQPCGGCTSLCELTGKPSKFHILDGVLYTNLANKMALYPAGLTAERFEIPSNTTCLMAGSITDNAYLKELVIDPTVCTVRDTIQNMAALETLEFPEGVGEIDGTVASDCPSLTTVYLPKTLDYTGYNYATDKAGFLANTPALTDVYYNGLETQFEKISNITRNKNIYRKGVTIHFSDEGDYEKFFDGDEENGGFTYKIYDGHAKVSGYTFGTKNKPGLKDTIEVAAEVKGQPVTAVERKAFQSFANVGEIVLPDTIRVIGEQAFQGCLVQVNIPKHVRSIGDSAFYGANLQTVTLPGTLEKMGKYVFRKSFVREVIAEEGVTVIGECAFGECDKLTSVKLPSTLEGIHGYAFNCTSALESIELPYGMTWIGSYAFNNSGIQRINLPDTIIELNECAFANCENLTAVTIPAQLTTIQKGAFSNSGLEDVTIPATVERIEQSAFCDCRKLKRITILNPKCYIFDAEDVICTSYEIPDMTAPDDEHPVNLVQFPDIRYDFVMCGYENSTAQEYAQKCNIEFEIFDPAAYEVTDAVALQRYLLGAGASGGRRDYDLNGDEEIDVFDLALLKHKLTEK